MDITASSVPAEEPKEGESANKFTGFKVECWIDGVLVSQNLTVVDQCSRMDFGFPLFVKRDLGDLLVLKGYDLIPEFVRVPA